jgi:hypothetical protein
MRVRRTVCLLALATLPLANPAYGQDVFMLGLGTTSCGKWTEASKNPVPRAQFHGWVFGFLTGVNWHSNGPQATVPDAAAAGAFLDEYCKRNPLHIVALGASALVQESGGPKALHNWKR